MSDDPVLAIERKMADDFVTLICDAQKKHGTPHAAMVAHAMLSAACGGLAACYNEEYLGYLLTDIASRYAGPKQ